MQNLPDVRSFCRVYKLTALEEAMQFLQSLHVCATLTQRHASYSPHALYVQSRSTNIGYADRAEDLHVKSTDKKQRPHAKLFYRSLYLHLFVPQGGVMASPA